MKKLIAVTIALAMLVGSAGEFEAAKKKVTKPKTKKVAYAKMIDNPNAQSNVVFYIPHQDDETLTMGVGIMNHVMGGHNVHVVLLTDGSASAVRTQLNMTESNFTAARNREFAYALAAMGVKPQNVHYKNYKDGQLTVANMEAVVEEYELKYPDAKHKTYSYTDSAHDHTVAGQGLKNALTKGITADARFYVRRGESPAGLPLAREVVNELHLPFLLAAGAAYKLENTRLGFYGIGYKSVTASFNAHNIEPLSRYHK